MEPSLFAARAVAGIRLVGPAILEMDSRMQGEQRVETSKACLAIGCFRLKCIAGRSIRIFNSWVRDDTFSNVGLV